eukprot:Seg139.2 transcript_id=Seg139.2/GoldUCD/mRNA.D3Y31 product="Glutathione peroxidase 1" protein_id=Seg139.2/GoldUCD/D3Y31
MNELIENYESQGLSILGFPCNQFGHQENCTNEEILPFLAHVRPGNGFVPKIDMFSKVQVNGSDAHSLFKYLKKQLPFPSDDSETLLNDCRFAIWSPIHRSDIGWNFEKFLIGPDGKPVKRYSRYYQNKDIAVDIERLLSSVKK